MRTCRREKQPKKNKICSCFIRISRLVGPGQGMSIHIYRYRKTIHTKKHIYCCRYQGRYLFLIASYALLKNVKFFVLYFISTFSIFSSSLESLVLCDLHSQCNNSCCLESSMYIRTYSFRNRGLGINIYSVFKPALNLGLIEFKEGACS